MKANTQSDPWAKPAKKENHVDPTEKTQRTGGAGLDSDAKTEGAAQGSAQGRGRLSIRSKVISLLFLSIVLPLTLGVIGFDLASYKRFRHSLGASIESRTIALALHIQQILDFQIHAVEEWISIFPIHEIEALPTLHRAPSSSHTDPHPGPLAPNDPAVLQCLENPVAKRLHHFQSTHPEYVSLSLAAPDGTLLATTEPPAFLNQKQNPWWPQLTPHPSPFLKFIRVEEQGLANCRFHLLIAVHTGGGSERRLVALLHAVIRAPDPNLFLIPGHDFLKAFLVIRRNENFHVVDPSGDLRPKMVLESMLALIRKGSGWAYVRLDQEEELVVVTPLLPPSIFPASAKGSLAYPAWEKLTLVTTRSDSQTLAPMRRELYGIGITATLVILGCTSLGYIAAGKIIVDPILAFGTAARLVAAKARGTASLEETMATFNHVEKLALSASTIETQQLAEDFRTMTEQVLKRHEFLEAEVAARTAEIQGDLEIAREFQEALLPESYPMIPSPSLPSLSKLEFHHIYRPTRTVSGDFFNVTKLDDYRVAILIADVMGHGARSALVTSILHALIKSLRSEADDPAGFLAAVNQRFHSLLREGEDPILVTAFYLIMDTCSNSLTFASAGHPSPLLLRPGHPARELLTIRPDAAIGLFPETDFHNHFGDFTTGDLILLYTDGVPEASTPQGESFGLGRLREILSSSNPRSAIEANWNVLDTLLRFVSPETPADDICLVSILATQPVEFNHSGSTLP